MENKLPRRSCSLWVVLAVFLWITLFGFTRLVSSIASWYWLNFSGVAPGPLYLAISGGMVGLVSLVILAWLWLRRPGFRLAGSAAAVLFAVLYWADRLLVMNFAGRFHNAVFAAAFTILGLVYVIISLRPWKELSADHVENRTRN